MAISTTNILGEYNPLTEAFWDGSRWITREMVEDNVVYRQEIAAIRAFKAQTYTSSTPNPYKEIQFREPTPYEKVAIEMAKRSWVMGPDSRRKDGG